MDEKEEQKFPKKVMKAGFACEKTKVRKIGNKTMFFGEKCELVVNEKGTRGIHPSIKIEDLDGWIDEV
jgi:hypothetical protein